MLAGFCAAHYESAAKEFLVVQFKTLRTLIMPVTYDLGILHVAHTVEQFKEIALGGVE